MRSERVIISLATLVFSLGCSLPKSIHSDPGVDFVARPSSHFVASSTYQELVIDRMSGGEEAVVLEATPPSSAGPVYVFEVRGKPTAALWYDETGRITVRPTDPAAPIIGEVETSSTGGDLRLRFTTPDGVFSTSRFHRVGSQSLPQVLQRDMLAPYAMMGLPGIYRAEVRNAEGTSAGWLRVHILPYQGLPRDYDADVPPQLNGPMAAAAVQLVDAEIDEIIAHNALPGDRMPEGLAP